MIEIGLFMNASIEKELGIVVWDEVAPPFKDGAELYYRSCSHLKLPAQPRDCYSMAERIKKGIAKEENREMNKNSNLLVFPSNYDAQQIINTILKKRSEITEIVFIYKGNDGVWNAGWSNHEKEAEAIGMLEILKQKLLTA